jgi:hypothetical protein
LLLVCCPVLHLCIAIGMGSSSCHSASLSWLRSTAFGSSSSRNKSRSSSWRSSNVAAPCVCRTSRTSGGCRCDSRCSQRLLGTGLRVSNSHQARQLGLRLRPLPLPLLLLRMRGLLLLLLVMSLLDRPLSSSGSVVQQPCCAPCRPGVLAAPISAPIRGGTLQLHRPLWRQYCACCRCC